MSALLEPPNPRHHSLSSGVVKRLEKQIQDEETPIVSKFVTWLNLLKFVDEGESILLEGEKLAPSDLEVVEKCHHNILESCIVLGEHLITLNGIEKALSVLNCTTNDFRAKIEMLRHKDRIWHGDLSPAKAEQILGMIFRAA